MHLAAAAPAADPSSQETIVFHLFSLTMNGFDLFLIAFTVIIALGVARLAKSPYRTKFSMGFSSLALLVFVVLDVLMVLNWVNMLQPFQNALFGG